jgi:gliding motility-associated-like protein
MYGYGLNGHEYFTEDISNIRGTKHLLHITDLNNCEIDTTIYVGEDIAMSVNYNIEDSACFASSASANFTPTITGVDLPTLVYSNLEDTITIVEFLTGPLFVTSNNDTIGSYGNTFFPGINWVEFETFGGIAWQHIWFVDSADNPTTIHYTHQNINCFGDNTGSISFSAEGNYGIFDYTINGPTGSVSTNHINSVPAGIFTLTAIDQVGCTDNQTVEVTEPPLLQGNINIENEILCNGFNTGYLSVNVNGGTGSYNYTWSNGDTVRQSYDLIANTYSINVTDSLGCIWNDLVTLNEPDPLILSLISSADATYFDMNDGEISFSVAGGTPIYTHYWQRNNEFYDYGHDTVLTNIKTGIYFLETEDQNGCFNTLQVSIGYSHAPLEVHLYEAFSPNNDEINDTYVINPEYLLDNPTVDIYSENNQHIYNSIGYPIPWDGTFNGDIMPDGKYVLIITYPSGEKIIHSFILKS